MSPKYVEKLENSYELWKHKMRTVVKSPGFETRMMWAYIFVLLFASCMNLSMLVNLRCLICKREIITSTF